MSAGYAIGTLPLTEQGRREIVALHDDNARQIRAIDRTLASNVGASQIPEERAALEIRRAILAGWNTNLERAIITGYC